MANRPKISRKRRQQILEAAVEVIAERGACKTRIADVAERGGTSAPLVLYYFESKDRLLTEALAFAEDRFYLAIFAEMTDLETASEKLVRFRGLEPRTTTVLSRANRVAEKSVFRPPADWEIPGSAEEAK